MLTAAKQLLFSGTSTGLRDLTLANVITDATRRAAVEGDGEAVPGGYRIDPAVTNVLTFPTDFSNAAWVTSSVTKTSTTETDAGGGSTGLLATITAAAPFLYEQVAATAGTEMTTSWWAKRGTSTAFLYAIYDVTNAAFIVSDVDYYAQTNATTWSRISATFTVPVGCSAVRVYPLRITGAASGTFYISWPQLETGAIAHAFTPTSRGEGSAQVAVQGLFTATQGWVAFAGVPRWTTAVPATNPRLFSWGDSTTNIIRVIYSAGAYEFANDATGGAAADTVTILTTVVSGTPNIVVAKWEAANLGLSVDGSAFTLKGSRAEIPTIAATLADIGSYSLTAARQFSGEVRWVVCGSGTLTNADAAKLNAFGSTVPTLNQLKQLSAASKPTLLIPADTSMSRLLPAYFGGVL